MFRSLLCKNINIIQKRKWGLKSVINFCWKTNSKETLSNYSTLSINPKSLKRDDPSLWVKSPYPDVELVHDVTVHEIIWSRLSVGKDREKRIAFECGVTGRKYTFGDVYKKSKAFATALYNAGLRKGDIVGIVLANIPEYSIAVFGAWEAGLTISPVNPAFTSDEIKRQLEIADVKCVITSPEYLPAVQVSQQKISKLEKIILIGDSHNGCHNFEEMLKTDPSGMKFDTGKVIDTMNEIAVIPFSSGTTGLPKGVMLTHYNISNMMNQFNQPDVTSFNEYNDVNEPERLIGLLPFFHVFGLSGILLLGCYLGANTLCLPKFDTKSFLKAFRNHKPTSLHLVTPLISHIVNSPDFGKQELENVHTIVAGAAPIGSTLINRVLEKAEKFVFFQEGYGLTELSPLSHLVNPSVRNTKVGSCGRPVPNTWTKIIDTETGNTLPMNNRGELCIKGPQIMKGYYKNEEATKNTIDSDGWLHTGDVAYYDSDGFCYIVDRLKELIKVKGYQVAPSELEDKLRKHPNISDVAVIGVPDDEWGEAARAYIVRTDEKLDAKQVNEYLDDKVVSYKKLKGGIEFVKTIPKASSGKILRREIMDSYRRTHQSIS